MKRVLAGVIAMALTASAATVYAGETPAPAADTAAAAPAPVPAPAAPPAAQPPVAQPAPAPAAPAASATPLALHTAPPPAKPLTLAPANDGMGLGTKLLLVLGIGAGVALYLKKKKAAAAAPGAKAPTKIEILARSSLGVRSQLAVIEVDGTRLLVGMTPSAISTLAVLETPEGMGVPAEDHESQLVPNLPPPSLLREVVGERPQNLGERFRSLIGSEEAVMPRISPIKPATTKPRAARPNAKTSQSRTKAEPATRESREVAGQARGLLLSVEDEK